MRPEELLEFTNGLVAWTRSTAPVVWSEKADAGSLFHWPPGVPRNDFSALAAYHAETLDFGRLMFVGRDITYLAAKTEMPKFRLELDSFPQGKRSGFIMWEVPIGQSEPRGRLSATHDADGNPVDVHWAEGVLESFEGADVPVHAASWRLSDDATEVLVCFYSDGEKARQGIQKELRRVQDSLGVNMSSKDQVLRSALQDKQELLTRLAMSKMAAEAAELQGSDPLPLEREQVLPLGQTLAWIGEGEDDHASLKATINITDKEELVSLAQKKGVGEQFLAAHDAYNPVLNQMIKTFVATLLLEKMKLASRVELPAPRPAKKRMRRAGADDRQVERTVTVVRIGQPLQHRAKKESTGKGGQWGVKTIVGPVVRTVQYVPATKEYREGIWTIEPYIAGPRDAPWSPRTKVYLLD